VKIRTLVISVLVVSIIIKVIISIYYLVGLSYYYERLSLDFGRRERTASSELKSHVTALQLQNKASELFARIYGRGDRMVQPNYERSRKLETELASIENLKSNTKLMIDYDNDKIIHFNKMRLKYRKASRFPWIHVAPDPPLPKPPQLNKFFQDNRDTPSRQPGGEPKRWTT
jgi:hypothetical protein